MGRLGPDLCKSDTDLATVVNLLLSYPDAGARLGEVLLDQRVMCGVGNVYRSEVLWANELSPFAVAGALIVAVTATMRGFARVQYWSARAGLPRDAPSWSRTCARCGRPVQAATWPSREFPPVRDDGAAVCGRCGGVREPDQQRADVEARREAINRWIDGEPS